MYRLEDSTMLLLKRLVSLNDFTLYLIIGAANSALAYTLIFLLLLILKIPPELSNFIGYTVGFCVSYILNKKYNFKSYHSHKKEFPKFIISMGIAYLVNLSVVSITFRVFELNVYVSQLAGGFFYVITGYLMSKHFVFREGQ